MCTLGDTILSASVWIHPRVHVITRPQLQHIPFFHIANLTLLYLYPTEVTGHPSAAPVISYSFFSPIGSNPTLLCPDASAAVTAHLVTSVRILIYDFS